MLRRKKLILSMVTLCWLGNLADVWAMDTAEQKSGAGRPAVVSEFENLSAAQNAFLRGILDDFEQRKKKAATIFATLPDDLRHKIDTAKEQFVGFSQRINLRCIIADLVERLEEKLKIIIADNPSNMWSVVRSLRNLAEIRKDFEEGGGVAFAQAIASLNRGLSPYELAGGVIRKFASSEVGGFVQNMIGGGRDDGDLQISATGVWSDGGLDKLLEALGGVKALCNGELNVLHDAEFITSFERDIDDLMEYAHAFKTRSAHPVAKKIISVLAETTVKLKVAFDGILVQLLEYGPTDVKEREELEFLIRKNLYPPTDSSDAHFLHYAVMKEAFILSEYKRVVEGFELVSTRSKLDGVSGEALISFHTFLDNAFEIVAKCFDLYVDDLSEKQFQAEYRQELVDNDVRQRADGVLIHSNGLPYKVQTQRYAQRLLGQRFTLMRSAGVMRGILPEVLRQFLGMAVAAWHFFDARGLLNKQELFTTIFSGDKDASTSTLTKSLIHNGNFLMLVMVGWNYLGLNKFWQSSRAPVSDAFKELGVALSYYHIFYTQMFNSKSLAEVVMGIDEKHSLWPKDNRLVKMYINKFVLTAGGYGCTRLEELMYQKISVENQQWIRKCTLDIVKPGMLDMVLRACLPMVLLQDTPLVTKIVNFRESDFYSAEFSSQYQRCTPEERRRIYFERTICRYIVGSVGFHLGKRLGQVLSGPVIRGLEWCAEKLLQGLGKIGLVSAETQELIAACSHFVQGDVLADMLVGPFFLCGSAAPLRAVAIQFACERMGPEEAAKIDWANEQKANFYIVYQVLSLLVQKGFLEQSDANSIVTEYDAAAGAGAGTVTGLVESLSGTQQTITPIGLLVGKTMAAVKRNCVGVCFGYLGQYGGEKLGDTLYDGHIGSRYQK